MANRVAKVDARVTGAGKAVLYARYSSHNQKDASIEQQLRECRAYAKKNDMQVIAEYADRAVSGKTDQRPEFLRMVNDARRGFFQYVITWKVDRFARNRYDAAEYRMKLKKYGVTIKYAKEDIPEGPEGILLESILEGSAEYYSMSLAQNIRRGMEDNARECKVNGSRVIGYRPGPDQRYEIDPDTAPVVRLIFERYVSNVTMQAIADELNDRGLRSIRGHPFDVNSVTRVLKNEKYTGIYQFGSIRVEDGVPQIIEKEMFEAVQKKLERNKRAPAHRWDIADYLLTGKLFCGLCKSPMVGRAGTGKSGTKYNYYACVRRTRQKACDKQPASKEWIEALVAKITMQQLLDDKAIDYIADCVVQLQEHDRDSSMLRAYESKLKETEKSIQNILRVIEAGTVTPSITERLKELEAEKSQLDANIEAEKLGSPFIEKDAIAAYLRQIKQGDPNEFETQRRIIEGVVGAVYLYDDKVVVTYNFGGREEQYEAHFVDEAVEMIDDLPALECSPLPPSAPPSSGKSIKSGFS